MKLSFYRETDVKWTGSQFVCGAGTTELERGISERNYNFDKQC